MPVRAVHHAGAVRSRATARWCRVKAVLRSPPSPILRLPIPLLLPCEVLLQVAEYLPPESVVALVCCCKYMAGLYCEDGTRPTEHLWNALLARTFPARHTGAPGPNGPPRLRGTSRVAVGIFSAEWTSYRAELLAAPRLTGVQIARFVRWATSAHSWYKHLPLQEAAIFSLVLDLTCAMKRQPDGYVEQKEGDPRTHYSWLPTKAYREAFGLLTYRDALPAFMPGCADGPRSVSVQRLDGDRVWLPAYLVEVGSCCVTAACHGRAESYQIYHHLYEAYSEARGAGELKPPPPQSAKPPQPAVAPPTVYTSPHGAPSSPQKPASPQRRHAYSYERKEAQQESFQTLPNEVLRDFERLYRFEQSGLQHTAEAQRVLIHALFPRLSLKQVTRLQERQPWGTPWHVGGAYLGAPNVVVTAQKAREWQRMFERAAAFCERLYGESVSMDGIKPWTMTCLALETLPTPLQDIITS